MRGRVDELRKEGTGNRENRCDIGNKYGLLQKDWSTGKRTGRGRERGAKMRNRY